MFAGSDSGGEHAAVLYSLIGTCRLNNVEPEKWRKRTARAVLTGMCYSAGSAMRHGSSSLTRLTGQSAMT
ncbi:transposase domain-containing protein, partial [Escherichia coli]|nr:transposase domain-containing protein [Escherichia coli]